MPSQTVADGSMVSEPVTSGVSRDGFNLVGWTYGGSVWDLSKDAVHRDMTLDAQWVSKEPTYKDSSNRLWSVDTSLNESALLLSVGQTVSVNASNSKGIFDGAVWESQNDGVTRASRASRSDDGYIGKITGIGAGRTSVKVFIVEDGGPWTRTIKVHVTNSEESGSSNDSENSSSTSSSSDNSTSSGESSSSNDSGSTSSTSSSAAYMVGKTYTVGSGTNKASFKIIGQKTAIYTKCKVASGKKSAVVKLPKRKKAAYEKIFTKSITGSSSKLNIKAY